MIYVTWWPVPAFDVIRIQITGDGYPINEYTVSEEDFADSYMGTDYMIDRAVQAYREKYNITEGSICVDQKPLSKKKTPWAVMKDELSGKFPLLNMLSKCPVCYYGNEDNVRSLIIHLNDSHKWSREQVAAWVDGLS